MDERRAHRVDTFRSLRGELEAGEVPLATSLDGRRFSFQPLVNELAAAQAGSCTDPRHDTPGAEIARAFRPHRVMRRLLRGVSVGSDARRTPLRAGIHRIDVDADVTAARARSRRQSCGTLEEGTASAVKSRPARRNAEELQSS